MDIGPPASPFRFRLLGVRVVLVLASLALSATSAGAETGTRGQGEAARNEACTWNLAQDFALTPGEGNPNPDSCGNPRVWWFLQATSFRQPSTYTPLRQFIGDAFGIPGAEQWQGTWDEDGGLNQLPAIGVNATGDVVHFVGIRWPEGRMRVHPLAGQPAVVGWRSPTAEPLLVRLALSDMDPTCGDGIRWSVNLGSHVLTSGSFPKGGNDRIEITVEPLVGGFVYFVVDAGPRRDFFCDSTSLGVSVQVVDSAITDVG